MIEVNPAAFILARFYSLANLSVRLRRKIFDDAVNDELSLRHSASLKFAEAFHLLSASQGRQKALLRLAGLLMSLPTGTSRSHLADARSIPSSTSLKDGIIFTAGIPHSATDRWRSLSGKPPHDFPISNYPRKPGNFIVSLVVNLAYGKERPARRAFLGQRRQLSESFLSTGQSY
jgi:hypothetical protein